MVRFDEPIPVVHIVPLHRAGGSRCGSSGGCGSGGARGPMMAVVQRLHQLGDLAGEARDLAGQTSQHQLHGVEGWEALVWLASHPGG